ncbi:unnamed protein product, partial [Nesidiocoris tenuis]
VTMAPGVPATSPGLLPVAEEIQGPTPSSSRESKSHQQLSDKLNKANQSIDWYFKNYNKTNLTPFVGGPGMVSSITRNTAAPASHYNHIWVALAVVFLGAA